MLAFVPAHPVAALVFVAFDALVAGYVIGRLHARMLRVIDAAPVPPPGMAGLQFDWDDPRTRYPDAPPPPPGGAGPPDPPLHRPVSDARASELFLAGGAGDSTGGCELYEDVGPDHPARISPDVAREARVIDDPPRCDPNGHFFGQGLTCQCGEAPTPFGVANGRIVGETPKERARLGLVSNVVPIDRASRRA